MRLTSLRSQLMLWLLLPLGIFMVISSWLTYRNSVEMATDTHDRLLQGSARMIAEQIRYDDGIFQVIVPPAALELFESGARDRVFYRVTSSRGQLLAGSDDLPLPDQIPAIDAARFFSTTYRGELVRISAFGKSVISAPDDEHVIVEVAQTLRAHKIFSDRIWEHALLQHLLILPFVAVLLQVSVRRALSSIVALRERIQNRRRDSLEPLNRGNVPDELVPMVDAINHYIARLDAQVAAHDRFVANASHQLRTPLTVLTTQVDYGLRSTTSQEKDVALRAMAGSLQHGRRLVNQLLLLSSAEASIGGSAARRCESIDLLVVIREVFEDFTSFARGRQIDLGFDSRLDTAPVRNGMLRDMVSNLLDNALRYTPVGGIVTVSLERQGAQLVLEVADNGPGIPDQERGRVFDRFYRISSSQADGTGLGLAIVAEIVAAMGATISLSAPAAHSGLVVRVEMQTA